ncbi:MAG TPA: LysR family transcriptional regulator [Methylibium sp.]|uniref:winged helix-turn-helix domain-containing protein n=1 Tax=Methylibium sp. TaxID=2067992 RepID=UPI002DB56567|nr:LysR family transcriptional regulator [Methylibium sp.]HEU4460464.1 LysR family transcriptional regulator [Methylibium sp.]
MSAPPRAGAHAKAGPPRLRFRVRVSLGDVVPIGPGKVDLLEAVREQGSIAGAARALGMSYRRAWLLLDEMNATLIAPVVETAHGGATGGGAVLTPTGTAVLQHYRALEAEAAAATRPHAQALLRLVARERSPG